MIILEVVVLSAEFVHVRSEDGKIDVTFAHDELMRSVLRGRESVRLFAHCARTENGDIVITPINEVQ